MDLVTQSGSPERWLSPSILLAAAFDTRSALASAGWFASLFEWEDRFPGHHVPILIEHLNFEVVGDSTLLTDGGRQFDLVHIEVALDGTPGLPTIDALLRQFVPSCILDELPNLPDYAAVTVNSNRDTEAPESWAALGASFIDVPVNTLPSTRGGSLAVISATRWARVVRWNVGLLVVWTPPNGYWNAIDVRWPHHAIPSRKRESLAMMLDDSRTVDARLLDWFREASAHERYFLGTWTTELEVWESQLFAQLARGQQAYSTINLPTLQRDIGVLAGYLDRVRVSQRFYLRRAEVSAVVGGVPGLQDLFNDVQQHLGADLRQARESLRSAFELLSSVSQGAQAYAAAESQKGQERLNKVLTAVTAVLFVPTLVAGVYGTNVRELSPGSSGSLLELFALMFGLSLSSIGVLTWGRAGKPTLWSGTTCVIGLLVTVAVVLRHSSPVAAVLVGLGGPILAVLLALTLQFVTRLSNARSH
ncbi:hypothetical protein EH165_00070 [Nakamurella antarctica]|uniref:CorA-like Mg2+ transporter protein n=1 Tax=Nakamurella antarctica TaxID=1902245 RepID=A0A3G8ZQG6_9ACTN|nr:CorA family divalent cation transporter [Nakamurella antarctica]AZI56804.1 hypothetical protein EH165_00070 [Nakamurella antarctica]